MPFTGLQKFSMNFPITAPLRLCLTNVMVVRNRPIFRSLTRTSSWPCSITAAMLFAKDFDQGRFSGTPKPDGPGHRQQKSAWKSPHRKLRSADFYYVLKAQDERRNEPSTREEFFVPNIYLNFYTTWFKHATTWNLFKKERRQTPAQGAFVGF